MYAIIMMAFPCMFSFGWVYAAPVSEDVARIAAENWYWEVSGIKPMKAILADSLVNKIHQTTCLYFYSFEEGGFVVIAGDDGAYPVLFYTLKSAYAKEDQPPQFAAMMELVCAAIADAHDKGTSAPPQTAEEWQRLTALKEAFSPDRSSPRKEVSPLLSTTWNLGHIEYVLCGLYS